MPTRVPIMAESQASATALPKKTGTTKTPPPEGGGVFVNRDTQRGISTVLGRPGSDLLSQGLSHSTIGAEEFNGRVRDGIGFMLLARTTRPAKDRETKQAVWSFISWFKDALSRSSP